MPRFAAAVLLLAVTGLALTGTAGLPVRLRILRGRRRRKRDCTHENEQTDAEGRLSVTLDQRGPCMLRVTLIRPSAARKGEWDSAFTTLTVEVQDR